VAVTTSPVRLYTMAFGFAFSSVLISSQAAQGAGSGSSVFSSAAGSGSSPLIRSVKSARKMVPAGASVEPSSARPNQLSDRAYR